MLMCLAPGDLGCHAQSLVLETLCAPFAVGDNLLVGLDLVSMYCDLILKAPMVELSTVAEEALAAAVPSDFRPCWVPERIFRCSEI